jgi:two-component system response regulator PilR (NtrC family)
MTKHDEAFHILIVDDNTELREILEEYLRVEVCQVDGASNGKEALIKQSNAPYDLIITDLNMPEVSGMEMIRRIRQENDVTEFIIITGYASLDSAVEAVRMGAFDYIVKPFRMEELRVVVKNVRDKVGLKKLNVTLFNKLRGLYEEIERYKYKVHFENAEPLNTNVADTEHILMEIKKIEKLAKGRLFID